MTLEELLADLQDEANVLKMHGQVFQANTLHGACDRVREVMAPYLDWLTEDEARARSGRSVDWLRGQLPEWEALGPAKRDGKRRLYRRLIVPRRANLEAARAAAQREARAA